MAIRPLKITKKQKAVMGVILREAGEGRFLNLKELHVAVQPHFETSYGGLRKCLDVLENDNMVERVRVSLHKEVRPTLRGYDWFRPLRG